MENQRPAQRYSHLNGREYQRNNQVSLTRDDENSGRWVAMDESGWDGEQLYQRTDRYLVIGSVAVDDTYAAPIVEQLRRDVGLLQPPELKFSHFAGRKNSDRLLALSNILSPGGALDGRAMVYLVDKHFFVAGKIIDLLLEEHAHAAGINLHAGRQAREIARTLFNEGPRALGNDGFNRLVESMVDFASLRNRGSYQVTVEELFDEINRAWARSSRRRVTEILLQLRQTRLHAEDYLEWLNNDGAIPRMEPLIPCLGSIAVKWTERIGILSLLADEHKVLTDDILDAAHKGASIDIGPLGKFITVPPSRSVRSIMRGVSRDHPSIQLADLVAGAGQAVARRHCGSSSPAGDNIWRTVVPIISSYSMVPHDDPDRFSSVST